MDAFELALAAPDAADTIGQVTRLYLVVLGRPPDPGGLRDHVLHLRAGTPLRPMAAGFLASGEFAAKAGVDDPRRTLCRHALGHEALAQLPPIEDPADLATALIQSPEVTARLKVLPALYPDGLLLRDPLDYRIWLAGLASDRAAPVGASEPVSILVALEQPDPPGLTQTLDSVLALDWPGLEVVVSGWRVGPALRKRAREDKRLRLCRAPFWYDRMQLLGHALRRARGAFAACMVPGDLLHDVPAVRAALPDADILLSDEDALDEQGRRHRPAFGDAWDPDRMRAAGRPGLPLIRTTLLRRTSLRRGGTADDLLLRAAALADPARIRHVPGLLLSRRTPSATVPRRLPCKLPDPPPRASIVIATRDRAELLGPCLDGLLTRTDYPDLEIVVVDNGSTAPDALALLDRMRAEKRVQVLSRPGPFNWAALNNDGAAAASGEVLVLLNNDIEVIEPGWLSELVAQALRPDVGAVGAKLLYPDRTIQHAGVVLGRDEHAMHMWRRSDGAAPGYLDSLVVVREAAAVTGACLALRRAVFDAVGGCDAANLPVTWNDIDLCLRVRERGLRVIWTPHATLLHLEQASRGSDDTPENDARFRREQAYMRRRWGEALRVDPFLNELLLPSETELRLAVRFDLPA